MAGGEDSVGELVVNKVVSSVVVTERVLSKVVSNGEVGGVVVVLGR